MPSRSVPVVTYGLIGVNLAVFLLQLSQGGQGELFAYRFGLVPARYSSPELMRYFSPGEQIFSLLSFMFLHGGFLHIISNMWSLYIFGDNVEERLGPLRYLAFYLLCGLISGLAHLVFNLHSEVPAIGASGALSGVMGAYFVLYPRAKILTLVPIVFIPLFFEVPAFFFLGLWIVLQVVNALASAGQATGIAWWAHIGGFAAGALLLRLFTRLPTIGLSERFRLATERRRSHHLQMVRPDAGPADDLVGELGITPFEALAGTRKMISLPWGLQRRLLRVNVPPGVKPGNLLRLRGLGRPGSGGRRGDLLLRIVIRDPG
jgi:hypothetical protein